MALHNELPDEIVQILMKTFLEVEDILGAPRGALLLLTKENDWSIVIKSHALIEGAVSLLLASLTDKRLADPFKHLPLGDEEAGKLIFAKALDALSVGERRFIKKVSNLRNTLAHDPRYLSFDFKEFLAGLDKNQRVALSEAVAFDIKLEEHRRRWVDYFQREPGNCLVSAVTRLLYNIALRAKLQLPAEDMSEATRREIQKLLRDDYSETDAH